MDRRNALFGGGLLLLAAAAIADDDMHAHHHHDAGPFAGVASAAGDCVAKGEACLNHCLVLLGDGDTSIAGCAKAVNAMLAVSAALQKLAAQGSHLAATQARVALDACKECEDECRKHEDKHQPCKDCAVACGGALRAIKAALA